MRYLIKRAGRVFSSVLFLACITKAPAQTAAEWNTFNITDLTVPSASPLLSSYFTQTLDSSRRANFDYLDIGFNTHEFKVHEKGQDDTGSSQVNVAAAIKLQLPNWTLFRFEIPLYGGSVLTISDTVKASSNTGLFAGSGLHIITDYVSLYGYAAYGYDSHADRNAYNAAYKNWEESGSGLQPVMSDYGHKTHGLLWSVMPVVTAKNIPLLGSVFSLFDAYLTLGSDADGFRPSYQARALFRDIPVGNARIGLAAITGSDWYNSLDAKYTVYGGRIGFQSADFQLLKVPTKVSVIAEAGYRMFFDVAAENSSFYQDGPYGRLFLGLSSWTDTMDIYSLSKSTGRFNWYLMVESSRQSWPWPKFGLMLIYKYQWEGKIYTDFFYEDDYANGAKLALSYKDAAWVRRDSFRSVWESWRKSLLQ
ncbi:MAG: hypothetical protein LBD24_01335 [Spirochaetaceae bacterium]|nr:hypothetical protein [Spirochaetaceae bacterium]